MAKLLNFLFSLYGKGDNLYNTIEKELNGMGFLYRVRAALARFMYGRNGVDQLCFAMFAAEVIVYGAAAFTRNMAVWRVLRYLSLAILALTLYRMFSKNLNKRRAENAKFVYWWNSFRGSLRLSRDRLTDKQHRYVRCGCGAWCRVPRNIGKVEMICPKCGEKKIVKT